MLNSSKAEVMREGFIDSLDWWNLVVATDGTTLKDGGRPKAKASIPVGLLIVSITTDYPNERNMGDAKRLYKWVGLDSLSTAVHTLGGWPMQVSKASHLLSTTSTRCPQHVTLRWCRIWGLAWL